jgi:hypothetical protein
MPRLHRQLSKTRERERQKKVVREVEGMSVEEVQQALRDHSSAVGRRQRRRAKGPRGEERAAILTEILTTAIKRLAEDFPKDYWRARHLRWKHACKRVAADLPPEAKRLFKRTVTWKGVARYTRELEYYSLDDQQKKTAKEIADRSGLLRR